MVIDVSISKNCPLISILDRHIVVVFAVLRERYETGRAPGTYICIYMCIGMTTPRFFGSAILIRPGPRCSC